MNRLKTNEGYLLEILIAILLFVTILLSMYSLKLCLVEEDKHHSEELSEMQEYHSSRGFSIINDNGYLILK